MYKRQPWLPIDVTLRLTQNSVPMPTYTKYIQKLRECIRWAHREANLFQQKEVQCQKGDTCSKAVALRMGDMVLVHVKTFKDRHKIQNRWENREYVVEKQSYPNLPVYVVHLIDREGCSQTLQRNYLFSISNNLEQVECENQVEEVGPIDEPTLVPPADNVLPANQQTESWPEGLPHAAPEQCDV